MLLFANEKGLQSYKVTPKGVILYVYTTKHCFRSYPWRFVSL